MIVVRAPLRISIAGGGTDLPFFSNIYGGHLLSVAIDKYNYIIIEKREFYNEIFVRYMENEIVKNVKDIKHTRVKATLEYLNIDDPIEITSLADVPSGTGLGSSGTYLVALLKALHIYKGDDATIKQLAEEAAHIEIDILGEPVGKHDQYLAAYGGLNRLVIDMEGKVEVKPLEISKSTLFELEHNLLLFYTNISRNATDVLIEQKTKVKNEKTKMNQMIEISKIGEKMIDALMDSDLKEYGRLLNIHWETKKSLTSKMSSTIIDHYYKIGLNNGALGGKIVGAGGGGFLLFYIDHGKNKLRTEMKKAGLNELFFRFEFEGTKLLYDGR